MYFSIVLLAVLITLVIVLIERYSREVRHYWEERGIPHPPFSLINSILKIFKVPIHEIYLDQYKTYGRIYGGFEFYRPVLTVCEPALLRDILVKDFHFFSCRRHFDSGDKIVNKMVSILKGEDWKRVRTVITPAFTSRKMRQMSHIINECTKTVIETFGKYSEKGEPVDCKGVFGAFTLDAIARSAFGTKIDSHNDPDNIFVKNAKTSFVEPSGLRILCILLAYYLLPNCITKLLNITVIPSTDFFRDVVLQVVKERKETGNKYDDILQIFMDAENENENEDLIVTANSDAHGDEVDKYGSVTSKRTGLRLKYRKLHEDELVAQCILFFIAGYETSASPLSFMAYELALNPECQEKLIREVDEAFKNHEELNHDVIRDMKYLDCVVSETLRMYPPLPRSERTAVEDYKLGNTGLTIDKGMIVGFNIHAMHFDPEFFPNPEEFNPERFMSENANHPQYAYLPFGAGPRNCLGMRFALMEIKLCMSNILRYYRFKKAETTKVPLKYKKCVPLLGVKDLPLSIERRNK